MRLVKTPLLLKKLFPNLIWNKSRTEKTVYLTFDDGPTIGITSWVLNELNKYNAKATFFCLGKNAELYPNILMKTIENGHRIGNHTFSHCNAWKTKLATYLKDVEHCSKIIDTHLFRPPYGKITPLLVKNLHKKYKIILWDIISYDFDADISVEQCYNNVINNVENGSIIVFHDSEKAFKNLRAVLPKVLKYLSDNGYKMDAL